MLLRRDRRIHKSKIEYLTDSPSYQEMWGKQYHKHPLCINFIFMGDGWKMLVLTSF